MAKEKIKSADDIAAEYMELQLSKSRESRFENIFLTALVMGFVFIFAVAFWAFPDKDFSEEENTTLSSFPEFTVDGFLHGDFTSDFATYMSDQFPFRDFFVGLKGVSEVAQLKGQNNNIILGDDGYLIARSDYPDEKALSSNITSMGNFMDVCTDYGIDCTVAFAGRKMDVMDEVLPSLYGTYYSDRIFTILDDLCSEGGITYTNLRNTLNGIDEEGLYYRTDHHWTSLGAYYAYCDVVKELGLEPYELSDFEIETATEEFFGTTWSSAGTKWIDPDSIEYFRWEGDESFTVRIRSPKYEYKNCEYITEGGVEYAVFDSFYIREMLEGKDKYASFLGGNNNGFVEITMTDENGDPVEGRETLIIVRDSFGDSIAPFLARHYDLILIDLRAGSEDIITLCKDRGLNNVLFLYNMETITTSKDLTNLNDGLSAHRENLKEDYAMLVCDSKEPYWTDGSFAGKKEALSFICEWDAKPESTPETLATIIKDGKEETVSVEILEIGGHYYKLFTGVCDSYNEAKKFCEDMGGMLCTVTSEEENLALYDYMTEYGFKSAYIGLSDSESEGCWAWENGETSEFEAWTKNVRFKH